jgi:hypothetical protein
MRDHHKADPEKLKSTTIYKFLSRRTEALSPGIRIAQIASSGHSLIFRCDRIQVASLGPTAGPTRSLLRIRRPKSRSRLYLFGAAPSNNALEKLRKTKDWTVKLL